MRAVEEAPEHGLDPELFSASRISSRRGESDESAKAELDVQLTATALKYALVMTTGLANTTAPDGNDRRGIQKKLISELDSALAQDNIRAWVKTLPPQSVGYERMKYALGVYRDIDAAGGWEILPNSLSSKSAKRLAHDERLARRLRVEGDLRENDDADDDSNPIVDALKRFQRRHGLASRGKIDKATLAALNVSSHERVLQIAANLERWRTYTRIPASTRVEVNAAAAIATLYRDNEPVMIMNAVVGKPKHDTPMLTSTITTIVINPPWVVPRSIIEKEIKPAIERKPDYLERNRMSWQGDQIIQEPGPGNSLGRIKFEFPNSYDVYLHDTPARALFKDVDRAQSHGCVRLERPIDLAADLLQDNGDEWSRDNIVQAIEEGETVRVPLTTQMSVTIAYWTAFVDDDGTVEFRPDVYGRDAPLAATLMPRSVEASDRDGA